MGLKGCDVNYHFFPLSKLSKDFLCQSFIWSFMTSKWLLDPNISLLLFFSQEFSPNTKWLLLFFLHRSGLLVHTIYTLTPQIVGSK